MSSQLLPLRSAMKSFLTGSFRSSPSWSRELLFCQCIPAYLGCACMCPQACHLAFSALLPISAVYGVQARAQSLGRILFGFYAVPDSSSVPIDFVINLEGNAARSTKR